MNALNDLKVRRAALAFILITAVLDIAMGIIIPVLPQRRDVSHPQRAREPAQQAARAGTFDETGQPFGAGDVRQAVAGLQRGIDHDAIETGIGDRIDQCQRWRKIGKHDRNAAGAGQRRQAAQAGTHGGVVAPALLPVPGEKSGLHVIDTGRSDARHRALHRLRVRLDIAGGRTGERTAGDEGDDLADHLCRQCAERTVGRLLQVDQIHPGFEHDARLVGVTHAGLGLAVDR